MYLPVGIPRDCEELKTKEGSSYSAGTKSIVFDDAAGAKSVHCDADGWTVFQSRGQFGNPTDFFYKGIADYKAGFGTAGSLFVSHLFYSASYTRFLFKVRNTGWVWTLSTL